MAIVFSSKINGDVPNIYTANNYYTGTALAFPSVLHRRLTRKQALRSSGAVSLWECATFSVACRWVSPGRLLR